MGFTYRLSWHFHFGRICLALMLCYFGYNMLLQGTEFYVPFLHAWRRVILPGSKNRINSGLTYEEAFGYVTQGVGALFILGGALVGLNWRVLGGMIALLAISFMLAT